MKHLVTALSLVSLTMAGTGFAAEEQKSEWQFGVALPMWAAGINGDTTVQGNKSDLDVSFSDLKDKLDYSYALGFTARKDKFGIYVGGSFMKLSNDASDGNGGKLDADLKFGIAEGGVSYVLVNTDEKHPFVLEATAGVRYWYTKLELEGTDAGGVPLFDVSKTINLVDPIIGLRGSQYITPKLHFDFAGDIGGFGVSDSSADLDWSATGLVAYDFTKWFTLAGGYKALGLDQSEGSGSSKNGVNMILNGALITATFKF